MLNVSKLLKLAGVGTVLFSVSLLFGIRCNVCNREYTKGRFCPHCARQNFRRADSEERERLLLAYQCANEEQRQRDNQQQQITEDFLRSISPRRLMEIWNNVMSEKFQLHNLYITIDGRVHRAGHPCNIYGEPIYSNDILGCNHDYEPFGCNYGYNLYGCNEINHYGYDCHNDYGCNHDYEPFGCNYGYNLYGCNKINHYGYDCHNDYGCNHDYEPFGCNYGYNPYGCNEMNHYGYDCHNDYGCYNDYDPFGCNEMGYHGYNCYSCQW